MCKSAKALALAAGLAVTLTSAAAAGTTPMEYVFTTESYGEVYDSYLTGTRYETEMHIEMAVTLDAPLGANLDSVPLSPSSWRYADGLYAETGSDLSRFHGRVSTNAEGEISSFLLQVFLKAGESPGVWVKRGTGGDSYATAMTQEVTVGSTSPCWRYLTCAPDPVTEWAQDRATGQGSIFVQSQSLGVSSRSATLVPVVSTPLPAPILMLGAVVAGLIELRRRTAA